MKKFHPFIIAGLVVFLAVALGSISCTAKPLTKVEQTRSLMGTFATVTVYSDKETADNAIGAAFTRMEEIEREASTFIDQSEVSQLNRDGYLDTPSHDILELLTMSADYSQLTDGYFDITVKPLLDLWSGGLWQESEEAQQSKIDETLGLVGWDKISIKDNRIDLEVEGMEITLGGIAKGYAADEALEVLRDMGIKHALVNVGGDMSTLGSKPDGKPWSVAMVNPDDTSQSLATFNISGKAIATSGNYERYFDPEKEVHHIINPKTGYSANESISVTVIAENGMQADALATGVFVMGPEEGMNLVESLDGVESLIVDTERVIHRSSGLSQYTSERQ